MVELFAQNVPQIFTPYFHYHVLKNLGNKCTMRFEYKQVNIYSICAIWLRRLLPPLEWIRYNFRSLEDEQKKYSSWCYESHDSFYFCKYQYVQAITSYELLLRYLGLQHFNVSEFLVQDLLGVLTPLYALFLYLQVRLSCPSLAL